MPGTVSHALSMTTPDDPAYENRPSHWNATHAITLNATGSEISGAFSNANGVSFGLNASTMTASHNALTSQSNQNVTAGNGGFAFQTLSFSNVNGFSFGTSAGSAITGSYTVPTQTNQTGGIYVTAQSTGQSSSSTYDLRTLSIIPDGIISAGWSAGSFRISATQSNQNVTAGNGGFAFQTLSFSNVNGISFGTSAGSAITASHNGLTTAALSDHSHGNPTLNLTNLSGTTASASNGFTLSLSAAAPGAAAITQSIGLSTQTAGGSIAGTTGYATGDDVLYHFVPGSNITMSQSLNGASATLSIYGPAAGGGATVSFVEIVDGGRMTTCGIWNNATYSNRPIFLPFRLGDALAACDTVRIMASRTGGTVLVATMFAGFYSFANSSSINLISSTSRNFSVSTSAQFSGIRRYDIDGLSALSLSQGEYVLGLQMSFAATNSGGLNFMGGDAFVDVGFVLAGTNSTAATHSQSHLFPMWGVFNATSAGLPSAVAKSSISGGASQNSPDIYAILGKL